LKEVVGVDVGISNPHLRRHPADVANGESKAEVAAKLGICRDTMHEWAKRHPEFSDAIKKGEHLSEAWWCKLGRKGAAGEADINPTVWIFNMKNRFGWRDKQDVTTDGGKLPHGPMEVVIVRSTEQA